MNLLVISHTPHYRNSQGTISGWGPTIIENDHIAGLFKSVTVLGFLHTQTCPESAIPYSSKNIHFKPLTPSGGSSIVARFHTIVVSFKYLFIILKELLSLQKNDWVYVRCPCNVGLITCLILPLFIYPKRWFKYAGNWSPPAREPLSYRLQRYLLKKNFGRGPVTINGEWKNQAVHLKSFLNPCLFEKDVKNLDNPDNQRLISVPIMLLFVGRVETQKGVPTLFSICEILQEKKFEFNLTIIGDGPQKPEFEKTCESLNLKERVSFKGELPHHDLHKYYSKAHFFLLPTFASEGWPKVLSEAMAYGCVPIASDISSIPTILNKYNCGLSLPINPVLWVENITRMLNNESEWKAFSLNGQKSAKWFTYENYITRLKKEIMG